MKTINSDIAVIDFNSSDSIIYEKLREDSNINLIKIRDHFIAVNALTNRKKHVALVDADDLIYIDQSALEFMAESFETAGRVAIAFYSHNLANRLSLLCLKMKYSPAVPFEMFTSKALAMEWLNSKKVIN